MSAGPSNWLCTEEEYLDIVQCYHISGKNLNLTQMCYANKYPARKTPDLCTLQKVEQKYRESLMSKSTSPRDKSTVCSKKAQRIVEYFISNNNASVEKAASIFCVHSSMIEKLLETRKYEIPHAKVKQHFIRKKKDTFKSNLDKSIIRTQDVTCHSEIDDDIKLDLDETISGTQDFASHSGIRNSETDNDSKSDLDETISGMEDGIFHSELRHSETDDDLILDLDKSITGNQYVTCRSEMRSSDDDDDFIWREMEYTKKRKKKYTKRHGMKKLKTFEKDQQNSQDLTSEVHAIVYTTRLEQMAILHKNIEHLDNETVMNEILLESKPKYDNMTKKTNDNVIRTITLSLLKKQLERFQRKKNIIDLTYSTKTSSFYKNYNIISNVCPTKLTLNSEDLETKGLTLEMSEMLNAIVYTTRLEEMTILHNYIEHLDNMTIINGILLESKPKYNYYMSKKRNNYVKRTISLKILKKKLKKLQRKEDLVGLTYNDNVSSFYNKDFTSINDIIISNVICPTKITLNTEDPDTILKTNLCNVVIEINNLFCSLCDIYVTDLKCNLIEYCCVTGDDRDTIVNQFDVTKTRLLLDACCWIYRHQKVESIWRRNECNFSRFLITKHKCPPDKCTCCCKPKERTTDITVNNPNIFINTLLSDKHIPNMYQNTYEKCLILDALKYKKSDTSQNIDLISFKYVERPTPRQKYSFKETVRKAKYTTMKHESIEIDNYCEILRYHRSPCFHNSHKRCHVIAPGNIPSFTICCKWMRNTLLYHEYKANKISPHTLRFLIGRQSAICISCKNKLAIKKTLTSNSDDIDKPNIEHTRTCVKIYKINTSSFTEQKNLRDSISTSETAKVPSTVKLTVTCIQIPEFVFDMDNVDYQIATESVSTFNHFKCIVKEDFKVIASSNKAIHKTTSTKVFKLLGQILLGIQSYLKLHAPLPPESNMDLVAKIETPGGVVTINNSLNNSQINLKTFQNVVKDTVAESYDETAVKHTEIVTKNFHKQSDMNSFKNINFVPCEENIRVILDDSCRNQNTTIELNKSQNSEQRLNKNSQTRNDKEVDTTSDDIHCNEYKTPLNQHDLFTHVISCSKKCYVKSFKSYLKMENEATCIGFPKISSVFSLQNSNQQNKITTNEPSTSKIAEVTDLSMLNIESATCSSSYNGNNINIENNFNSCNPPICPLILYDPETNMAQMVHLTPKGLFVPIKANSLNQSTLLNKQSIIQENDLSIDVVTPINQICDDDNNMPNTLEQFILPDIINDIPKNIVGDKENCDIVVKEEEDDVVLVSDSD